MKVITYIRVSTLKQKDGNGLELQQNACELEVRFLQNKLNIKIDEILVFEEIISATTKVTERVVLSHALKLLQEDDWFVVSDIERLARDDKVLARIVSIIFAAKAKLIVVKENEKQQEEEFTLKQTSKQKVLRSQEAAVKKSKEKKKKKEIGGNIPYGYCLAEDGIHFEKDKDEQYILKKVERDKAKGIKRQETADYLNRKNLTNREEQLFTANAISKIRKRIIKVNKPALHNPKWGLQIIDGEYEINYKEQELIDLFTELYPQGLSSAQMTRIANSLGHKNRNDGPIWPYQTSRIIKRLNL